MVTNTIVSIKKEKYLDRIYDTDPIPPGMVMGIGILNHLEFRWEAFLFGY